MNDVEHILEIAFSHHQAGRLAEARDIYEKVLAIDSNQADAVHLLGMVYFAEKKYSEAISHIGRAILLDPQVADYHINIASAYFTIGDVKQASLHAKRAIKIKPDAAEAHYNLGNALFAEGNVSEAVVAFEQALDLDPTNQTLWTNYLFALNFSSDASPKEVFSANRRWGERIEKQQPDNTGFTSKNGGNQKIRLAYFLPELDTHVTTRFLAPVLAAHDRSKFEIVGYGYRTDSATPPDSIRLGVDRWVEVGDKSARELAELMREDQIDILAHPCTFKARYREVLAHRAAPIQIACVNLVSSTGLVSTDYLVSDSYISPPELGDGIFTEKLIRLSGFNTYQKFDESRDVSPLPAIANGYVTFGSCNNIAKLSPKVIAAWSEILLKISSSKLLLKHRAFDNADRRSAIRDVFSSNGINEKRIIFEGFTADPAAYLSVYDKIDIALDPFPFGGGTVSYEALWMGVPILTLAGSAFMGRLTGSLMHQLDLDLWVTRSVEEYVLQTCLMAEDLNKLQEIRKDLRPRAKLSIFNAESHVKEFEAKLQEIWNSENSSAS